MITASALSLNVADVEASARFAESYLEFERAMSSDGFISLTRADAGFNLIFLALDLPTFKPAELAGHRADGIIVVLVVDDIDDVYADMTAAGAPVTTEIETEPWGERYFQTADPNGVVYQFVQWVDEPPSGVSS